MKDKYEVLMTADTGGGLGVWDPSTGNSLHQYKGGVTRANTATWVKQVNRQGAIIIFLAYWITSTILLDCMHSQSRLLL